MKSILIAVALTMLSASRAYAVTAQQQKMKDCNAVAAQKGLKGEERKTFMSNCLSGKEETQLTPQQQKMTDCNKAATAKGLKGEERQAFMKSCLSGK